MAMKKLEKNVIDKMVVNDGYNFRNSLRIFQDAILVTPYKPPEPEVAPEEAKEQQDAPNQPESKETATKKIVEIPKVKEEAAI